MIEAIPLLDSGQCAGAVARLEDIRAQWIDRSVTKCGTFFTVGRASYLDVCPQKADPKTDYYDRLAQSNAELVAAFSDLYEMLRRMLEERLGGAASYAQSLALPGFHLFFGRGIMGAGSSGRHFDIQYERLTLPEGRIVDDPISFTLALELPAGGSGLDIWNVTAGDYDAAFAAGRILTIEDLVARKTSAHFGYRAGTLYLQRGLFLHRIGSSGPIAEEDRRITLQGHGLNIDGRWRLYW